eukprot:3884188-Pleurochrysis_carterae.AAC.3
MTIHQSRTGCMSIGESICEALCASTDKAMLRWAHLQKRPCSTSCGTKGESACHSVPMLEVLGRNLSQAPDIADLAHHVPTPIPSLSLAPSRARSFICFACENRSASLLIGSLASLGWRQRSSDVRQRALGSPAHASSSGGSRGGRGGSGKEEGLAKGSEVVTVVP